MHDLSPEAQKQRLNLRLVVAVAVVTATAIFLRYWFVIHAQVDNPFRGDAAQYHAYAWNMVKHNVFSMTAPGSEPVPDNFRGPGYPLLLSAWMMITDDLDAWYAGVLLTQAVLGALTAALTLFLARLWLPLGWSVTCGMLTAFWPHNIAMTEYLLSETLFGFLLVLAIVLFGRALRKKHVRSAAVAGMALGFAALVNPLVLPLALLLPAAALFVRALPVRNVVAFAVSAALLPAAWGVRNALVVDGGASSRQHALVTLDVGSWPGFYEAWRASVGLEPSRPIEMPEHRKEERIEAGRKALDSMNREQALLLEDTSQGFNAILQRVSDAPVRYAVWYLLEKPALLWGWNIRMGQGDIYVNPTRGSAFDAMPLALVAAVCHGFNPILGLLALFATTGALSSRSKVGAFIAGASGPSGRAILLCVALLVAYLTVLHTILQAEPRYSIPYRPFEFVLGVTAIAAFARTGFDRAKRVGAARDDQRKTSIPTS
jgi:hypothetical protein